MTIKFSKETEQYTTAQRSTKVKHFMEFTSKKQLENAEVLVGEELEFAKSIKGTFNYALHEDLRYMAVTIYKANAEKKYNFLIVDLKEKAIAEVDSIKNAKAGILELVEEELPASDEDDGIEEALAATVQDILDEALNEK